MVGVEWKKGFRGRQDGTTIAIFTSCRIKAEIVEADEKEQNLRPF